MPKIYFAIHEFEDGKLTAICVAEDGTFVFVHPSSTIAIARYALNNWSHYSCKVNYPKGFQKVDLTSLTTDELAMHDEFMEAIRLNGQ